VQQRRGGLSGRHPTSYRGVMGATVSWRHVFHRAKSPATRLA
jgi:hypothetical protein